MANRVLLGPDIFRVSRPGIHANATSAPQNLLFDMGNLSTLGSYSTGQVNPLESGWKNYGLYGRCRIPFPNPGGYVPFVLVQQDFGSYATGGHYMYDSVTYREFNDYAYGGGQLYEQDQYYYWTEYDIYSNFSFYVEKSAAQVTTSSTAPLRYHAFYVKTSDDIFAPLDVVPNSISWADISTASATALTAWQTISGLEAGAQITLKITSTMAIESGVTLRCIVYRNSISYSFLFNEASNYIYVDVQNSDMMAFELKDTTSGTPRETTITVENASVEPLATLDQFNLKVSYSDRTPAPVNWNNSGSVNYVHTTNVQTITDINTSINLRADFSPAFTGRTGYGQMRYNYGTARTSAIALSAINGSGVAWHFRPTTSYSGTVSIVNASDANAVLDTFTLNITVPANTFNCAWGDVSAWAFSSGELITVEATTENAYIANLSGSKTLTVTVPFGYYRFYIYKNGVSTTYTSGTSFSVSVANGDRLAFGFAERGLQAQYSGTVTVSDGTNSTSFNVSLTIESNL